MLRIYWISGLCVSATVLIGNSVFATAPTYTYQDKIAREILTCGNYPQSPGQEGQGTTPMVYAFCQQLKTAHSTGGTSTIGWYVSNTTNSTNIDVENHLMDSGKMSKELYLCPPFTFPSAYQSNNYTFFTRGTTSATAIWTTQAEPPTGCANQTPTTQTIPSQATTRSAYNGSNTIGYTRTCSSRSTNITYAWCMQPPKSYPAPQNFNPQKGWYPAALNPHNNVYTCPTDNHQDVSPAKWSNTQSGQSSAPYYVSIQNYPPIWIVDSRQSDSNCGSIQHETIIAVPDQVTG